uniref:Uncharacterized protein n=1 Tax=Lactuca sativa TaxID=4236 RepID=A0A9R1VTT9_LACSA|nr:hypothetical protein LSAT_V11C400178920 [Lactuca sativa]
MFPFVPLSCFVSMDDLTNVFNMSHHQLSNEDVVRVSLIYMLEQGFLGKYLRQPVTNEHIAVVSNLQEFNRFGSSRHFPTVLFLVPIYRVLSLEQFDTLGCGVCMHPIVNVFSVLLMYAV